jgi:hypothetical protein
MKGNASPGNDGRIVPAGPAQVLTKVLHTQTPYLKVLDDRKRPIHGLQSTPRAGGGSAFYVKPKRMIL